MRESPDLESENLVLKRLLADAEVEKAVLRGRLDRLAPAPAEAAPTEVRRPANAASHPDAPAARPDRTRTAKRQRLRQRLQEIALELFERQGFEPTTVEEIAAAADVSTRTFFRYFESKADVLLVVQDGVQRDLLEAVDAHYDGSAGSLIEALTIFSDGLDRRRAELVRARRLLGSPELTPGHLRHSRATEDKLAVLIAAHAGTDAPDLGARIRAALIASTVVASMRVWLHDESEVPFRETFVAALRVMGELGGTALHVGVPHHRSVSHGDAPSPPRSVG